MGQPRIPGLPNISRRVLIEPMLMLFTDFGRDGPYVGQIHTVLARAAPGIPVIDLMHDAPACDPKASAYLLAALVPHMPERCTCLAVVDPGVGGTRPPIIVEADGRRFVGPGNGLFGLVIRRARNAGTRIIDWRPATLSRSFHGRDLFAPVAAMLARGEAPSTRAGEDTNGAAWPDDLPEAIYVDAFGNVMTGMRASSVDSEALIEAGGTRIRPAPTFSEVPPGETFWYENSLGLLEIAVNQGHAARELGLGPGTIVRVAS